MNAVKAQFLSGLGSWTSSIKFQFPQAAILFLKKKMFADILTLGFSQEIETEESQNICFIRDVYWKFPYECAIFGKFLYRLKNRCA
jgi:hypothetical protein